ncbi:MAG: NAD(P)H-quinone oxidoreductase [Methylococcales bacterium]
MTVIEIAEAGGPEVLVPVTRPLPRPGPDEVLIQVSAAGVNRPDVMQRKGLYPPPPGASDIPGLEIAGGVVSLGANVRNLNLNDRVCALVTGGGYAEYCLASARICLPIPAGLSEIQAAALPEACFTVWTNVFERGALMPGERFLVHGGSGGVGTTAIQMAAAFGSTVYTTASSEEKCEFCRRIGAQRAINYNEQDFVEVIKSETANKGVNLILDIIGGDYLNRNLSCLAPKGRLVQIALQKGPKTVINLLPIMLKRLTLTGTTLRPRSVTKKARIAESLRAKVWPLLEATTIRPIIHGTFPFHQASKAHELMESSAHIGKIVLTV